MEHPDGPTTFRLMVFNIEEGGVGVDLAQVIKAIRLADPDVVALQEAVGNTARIADGLGWAFASHRTQIVSRHPLLDPATHHAGPAFVEVRPGGFVAVASVHTPAEPYGPELARDGGSADEIVTLERRIRLPRIEPVLPRLRALAEGGLPVFLAGDMNAPSHLDWTRAAVGTRPHVRSVVDWPVSRAIEAAGLRDTWRERHPDPIREPGLTWWAARPPTGGYEPGPDTPDDRIDVIYAGGPSTTVDSWIVGEAGRPDVAIVVDPWPSDHRAVVATFEVRPAPLPRIHGAVVPPLAIALTPPAAVTRFETSAPTYRTGEPIEVSWDGGPGYRWDWVAVFRAPADELPDAHLIWEHTDAREAGSVRLGASSAVVDQSAIGGRWPLPPGSYVAAYLLDDGPTVLGRAAFDIVP